MTSQTIVFMHYSNNRKSRDFLQYYKKGSKIYYVAISEKKRETTDTSTDWTQQTSIIHSEKDKIMYLPTTGRVMKAVTGGEGVKFKRENCNN